jgi:hypothetical protein
MIARPSRSRGPENDSQLRKADFFPRFALGIMRKIRISVEVSEKKI